MKQLKLVNSENVSEEEAKNYQFREASRAIVFDDRNKIAMIYVSNKNYYKLPGGKIEKGEDKIIALQRECREEIGCEIEVICEIGSIVEYRKVFKQNQISYCYLAKVKGEKSITSFTNREKERGCELVWFSYDESVKALNESKINSSEGSLYIIPRDLAFLEEAKNYYNFDVI